MTSNLQINDNTLAHWSRPGLYQFDYIDASVELIILVYAFMSIESYMAGIVVHSKNSTKNVGTLIRVELHEYSDYILLDPNKSITLSN
jgi:hypothetical protein